MRFLKRILEPIVDKGFVSDAIKVVNVCRSYGPTERCELKACVLLALATLVTEANEENDKTIFTILEIMDSGRRPDSQELGQFSVYTMKLMSMQKQAHSSANQILNLVSAGIPIWIVSIRSLSSVSVLPYARELWSISQNCDPLVVYDCVNEIADKLSGHPIANTLLRLRSGFDTPNLFVSR